MAIATTANVLLGLRSTDSGRQYAESLVVQGGVDRELCEAGTEYILIPMLPFAVELCLKTVRCQAGGAFLWTHNLKLLWKDLDEAQRAGIRRRAEDPEWRSEEKRRREIMGIAVEIRTIDRVIDVHQNDFEHWRYVVEGERQLTEEEERVTIDEAIMDLYGLVYGCVGYHESRDARRQ